MSPRTQVRAGLRDLAPTLSDVAHAVDALRREVDELSATRLAAAAAGRGRPAGTATRQRAARSGSAAAASESRAAREVLEALEAKLDLKLAQIDERLDRRDAKAKRAREMRLMQDAGEPTSKDAVGTEPAATPAAPLTYSV